MTSAFLDWMCGPRPSFGPPPKRRVIRMWTPPFRRDWFLVVTRCGHLVWVHGLPPQMVHCAECQEDGYADSVRAAIQAVTDILKEARR